MFGQHPEVARASPAATGHLQLAANAYTTLAASPRSNIRRHRSCPELAASVRGVRGSLCHRSELSHSFFGRGRRFGAPILACLHRLADPRRRPDGAHGCGLLPPEVHQQLEACRVHEAERCARRSRRRAGAGDRHHPLARSLGPSGRRRPIPGRAHLAAAGRVRALHERQRRRARSRDRCRRCQDACGPQARRSR